MTEDPKADSQRWDFKCWKKITPKQKGQMNPFLTSFFLMGTNKNHPKVWSAYVNCIPSRDLELLFRINFSRHKTSSWAVGHGDVWCVTSMAAQIHKSCLVKKMWWKEGWWVSSWQAKPWNYPFSHNHYGSLKKWVAPFQKTGKFSTEPWFLGSRVAMLSL